LAAKNVIQRFHAFAFLDNRPTLPGSLLALLVEYLTLVAFVIHFLMTVLSSQRNSVNAADVLSSFNSGSVQLEAAVCQCRRAHCDLIVNENKLFCLSNVYLSHCLAIHVRLNR
jgi:hypothetical protein